MDITGTGGCEYRLLENGIHEFIWYKSDREAVDQYIAGIARVYDTADPNSLIRWLLRDGGISGLPSVNYFLQQVRDLERRYPDRPRTRAAVLYGSGVKILLLNCLVTLTNIRGKDNTRFFPLHQEAEAIAWLLEDN